MIISQLFTFLHHLEIVLVTRYNLIVGNMSITLQ